MDKPRNELRDRIGSSLPAGGERRPVVQVYKSQLPRRRDDDVPAENMKACGRGSSMGEVLQSNKTEWIFSGLARIEPVKKCSFSDAIEFYLVARPMRLQRGQVDPASREVSHSKIEAFD